MAVRLRTASGFISRMTRKEAWAAFVENPNLVRDSGKSEVYVPGVRYQGYKKPARQLEREEFLRWASQK